MLNGTFVFLHDSGKQTVLNPKAFVINKSIKSLIDMLCKKGYSKFKGKKYSKKLSEEGIDNSHIKTINSLINDLGSLCNNKDLDDETVHEIIKFVRQVTESDAEENYTEDYSAAQKKELLTATLELLSIQKFQNQIFTDGNRGFYQKTVDNKQVCEPKAIGQYIDALVNISNSNLFKFLSSVNQNKFFGILKLLFEDEKISKNIFSEDNLGKDGAIRLYITVLSNTAAKIKPPENIKKDSKTKKNSRKKRSIINNDHDKDQKDQKVEIFNYNIKFLIKATKKIVTDKNLRRLVFDIEKNPRAIAVFLNLPLNLARHIQYLHDIGYEDDKKFEGDKVLFDILETLFGKEFSNLFAIPQFYIKLFLCLGEISCYSNILNNEQHEKLSIMINTELLSEERTKNILSDKTFVGIYFEYLTMLFEKAKDLTKIKTLIASIYNCFEKSYVLQRMSGIKNELHACLRILESLTKECKNIDGKNLALVYEEIVGILKTIQNGNYLFKKQIFQSVENQKQINEKDVNNERWMLAFFDKDEKNSGNKKTMIRVYASMFNNISQLSSNKEINIKDKIEFFGVMRDILLKEDLQDIRTMIFNQNEQENDGAINNFTQAFSNLLSINNLNNLNKNDKKFCIESLVDFVCDKNLKNQICNLANNEKIKENDIPKYKSVTIRFYTGLLKNISQLSSEENVDIKYNQNFFSLIYDILIKKECDDIRKMIFNEKENGSQGSICNLIQIFYNLLSENNLKKLNESSKKSWIQLFLSFIYDEELQYQIFQLGNDAKNGAIDFYFRTLCNILRLGNTQFTPENKQSVASVIQNLKSKYAKARQNFTKCAYYSKIEEIGKIFDIQKTINNTKQKKIPFLESVKNIKNIFEPKKDLKTSNSMPNLLLPSQKLKISKSKNKLTLPTKDSRHEEKFTNKSKGISGSRTKLKTSKSMINFFKINKMFSNKQNLNINTFKSPENQINKKISSIKINSTAQDENNLFDPQKKSTEKPDMLDKNRSDKPKDF